MTKRVLRLAKCNETVKKSEQKATSLLRFIPLIFFVFKSSGIIYFHGSMVSYFENVYKHPFLWPLCPDRLWGPPSLLHNGYREAFRGGKARPGSHADHSPPSSAEVKKE
jgi:hypothetical protein